MLLSHGFSNRRFSDTWRFDLTLNRWEEVCGEVNQYDPYKPHARCLVGTTAVSATSLFMYGGCATGGQAIGNCPSQEGWHLESTASCDWEHLPWANDAPAPSRYSAVALFGASTTQAILYGGEVDFGKQVLEVTEPGDDEVVLVDLAGNDYRRVRTAGSPGPRRAKHGMAATATGVIVFGGLSTANSSEFLNTVLELTGTPAGAPTISSDTDFFNMLALHGIFMVLGWGFCLQTGAFIARYFRHRDPFWFKMHRAFQIVGLLLAIIGFIVILIGGSNQYAQAHPAIGVSILKGGGRGEEGAVYGRTNLAHPSADHAYLQLVVMLIGIFQVCVWACSASLPPLSVLVVLIHAALYAGCEWRAAPAQGDAAAEEACGLGAGAQERWPRGAAAGHDQHSARPLCHW